MKNKIIKRSSSSLDEKSLMIDVKVPSSTKVADSYKEYDLEVDGDPVLGLEYHINIYVGEKKLRINIDSGCCGCTIANRFLRGIPHQNTGISITSFSLSRELQERLVWLEFGLEPNYAPEDSFELLFGAPSRKDAPYFHEESVGLLGATFLQFCEVDFRRAKLRVFKSAKPNVKTLLTAEEFKKSA